MACEDTLREIVGIAETALGWIPLAAPEDGTDVTDLLNAQIAAASSGSVLVGSGRWRVDGTVSIGDRSDLTIIGPFTIYRPDAQSTGIHVDVIRSTNITIRQVSVEGANPVGADGFATYVSAKETEHAFAVRSGSENILIEDCTFQHVYGDGVYVGYHNDGIPNRDVTVRRLSGHHCGRQQIAVTHLHGGLFEDITIDFGARSGLDVEPNHDKESVRDVTFRRLNMGSRWYPYVIGGRVNGTLGDSGAYRSDITLENCSAGWQPTTSHPAVQASRGGRNLTVRDHTDTRNVQHHGIMAGTWEGVAVEGSTVGIARQTPTTYGVNIQDASGVLIIRNNDFTGSGGSDHGADLLFNYAGDPDDVTHCGNRWSSPGQGGVQTDGVCP